MNEMIGQGPTRREVLPTTESGLTPNPYVRSSGPGGLDALPDHDQAELVEAGERGQVGDRECSVGHVEVFQMAGVRTSIIGRPRPLPPHRRASHPVQTHQPATTPSFAKSR